MKKGLKIVSILIGSFSLCTAFLFLAYLKASKDHDEKMRKVTHIDIYFGERIENLISVDLKICDSIYTYKTEHIKDTICQNIGISDTVFPCEVLFNYNYVNGTKEKFFTEAFNCAGCSGSNSYKLNNSTIKYSYKN